MIGDGHSSGAGVGGLVGLFFILVDLAYLRVSLVPDPREYGGGGTVFVL